VGDGVDPGSGILDGLAIAEGHEVPQERFLRHFLGFLGAGFQGNQVDVDLPAPLGEELFDGFVECHAEAWKVSLQAIRQARRRFNDTLPK